MPRACAEPLPAGFEVGHWTDREAATGCTVVLAPPDGAVASGDVRGGGPGTPRDRPAEPDRERRAGPRGAAHRRQRVRARGRRRGRALAGAQRARLPDTPAASCRSCPAAVVYDLISGDPTRAARARPRATRPARPRGPTPQLGSVGAGTGAAVGKLRGRELAVKSGVGLAAQRPAPGPRLAALAVVNAFGDVIGEDGAVLAGTRGRGRLLHRRPTELLRAPAIEPPSFRAASRSRTRRWCA